MISRTGSGRAKATEPCGLRLVVRSAAECAATAEQTTTGGGSRRLRLTECAKACASRLLWLRLAKASEARRCRLLLLVVLRAKGTSTSKGAAGAAKAASRAAKGRGLLLWLSSGAKDASRGWLSGRAKCRLPEARCASSGRLAVLSVVLHSDFLWQYEL